MKIAIIGTASSRKSAPIEDDSWQWWGINNLYLEQMPIQWSAWFEIHHILFEGGLWTRRGKKTWRGLTIEKYLSDLNALNCPVYMQKKNPLVEQSTEYPLQEMLQKFGNYFNSTMSWMMALAIARRPEIIGLFGVDCAVSNPMASSDEYGRQRPGVEYFIGLAKGMGIKIFIPDESDLCKTRFLYGFEEPLENEFNAKLDRLTQKAIEEQKRWQQAVNESDAKLNQAIGAKMTLDRIKITWGNDYSN